MTDATFSNLVVRRDTAGAVEDLLALDSVDGSAGNGAALSFIDNSATEGLHLALGRISASRVDASTVRLDLAVVHDPTVSSGDDTPALLSLVSAASGLSVTTAPASSFAVGGPLTVSGSAAVSGALSAGGATTLSGGLTVNGNATLNGTLNTGGGATIGGALSASGATTLSGGLTVNGNATLSGALSVAGSVGIGMTDPGFKLDVAERMRVRQGGTPSAGIWFFQTTPASDQAFVGMASDTAVGFWGNTGIGWGLTMDTSSGDLTLKGSLSVPNSGGGAVSLTGRKYDNESALRKNNLKLSMAARGPFIFPGQQPLEYEFAIGHLWTSLLSGGVGVIKFSTTFNKVFSINQNGDAYFAGGKTGYVVDHFVNRVGDVLEQGDVVVISRDQRSIYTGADNNIPLPEVDLTDQAYDRRVCGIVARAVTENDLPHVEPPPGELVPPDTRLDEANRQPYVHPLGQLAAPSGADVDRTKVADRQIGTMVTLGAFAHCKVDADIAPIEAGDLLTTSPTRGHTQKVLEPERATGAIIAKALAPLAQGKGKIPVLVLLQ